MAGLSELGGRRAAGGAWTRGAGLETLPTGLVGGASLGCRRDPKEGCCAEKSRGLEESQGAGGRGGWGGPQGSESDLP